MIIFYVLKMAVFWNFAPYGLVHIDRRFRGTSYLSHQGDEYAFWSERDHLEYVGVHWRIFKMDLIGVGCESVDWVGWIQLAWDSVRWRAILNAVMKL
jgi:hypothetical protein